MTNREWLNNLNDEELVEMINAECSCVCCTYYMQGGCIKCSGNEENICEKGIKKWLKEKHTEPMAEIKIGDLLTFAGKKTEYTGIVVDDDTVFLHAEEKRHYLKLLIKDCVNIRRYDCWKDEWETIWRADNDR